MAHSGGDISGLKGHDSCHSDLPSTYRLNEEKYETVGNNAVSNSPSAFLTTGSSRKCFIGKFFQIP